MVNTNKVGLCSLWEEANFVCKIVVEKLRLSP